MVVTSATLVTMVVAVATLVTSIVAAMRAMRIFSWNMDAHKHISVSYKKEGRSSFRVCNQSIAAV